MRAASTPMQARVAASAVFFVNGAAFANWVTRIPDVQRRLGIGDGPLGLALFALAAGALVSMPLVGHLMVRHGSGPVTRVLAVAFCVALPLPALAPTWPLLVAALAALGVANGGMDVAMNAQAAAVERASGRPIMTSFHALYSAGGLLGALAGGLFAGARAAPPAHLAAVAVVLGLVAWSAGRRLLPGGADAHVAAGPAFARPDRTLLAVAALAFSVLLCEGAIADWSAVYLTHATGASPARAAAGFAAFSLAMTAGRFAGDRLTGALGPVRLVRLGGVVAALGLGAGLASGSSVVSIVGFGCVGAGFAGIFPCLVRAAARSRTLAPALAIAAVSTVGYGGFLAGPPVIGLLADRSSIRLGLTVVVALAVLVAALAPRLADAPESRTAAQPEG